MQNDPVSPFGARFLFGQGSDRSHSLLSIDDPSSSTTETSNSFSERNSNSEFEAFKQSMSSYSSISGGNHGNNGILASPMPMSPFALALEGARTERLRRLLYQNQDMLFNGIPLPFSSPTPDLLDSPTPLQLTRGLSFTDPFREHTMDQLSSITSANSAVAVAVGSMPPPPSLRRSMSSFGVPQAPLSPTTVAANRLIQEACNQVSKKPPATFLTQEDLQAQVGVPKPADSFTEDNKRTIRKWKLNFDDLAAFRLKYGHCDVPTQVDEFRSLTQWIKRQRYHYTLKTTGKPSSLTDERIQMLESIGFVWNSHCAAWEEKFAQLITFKKKNGHCNVPRSFPSNQQLSTWVKRQRRQYNARHLDAARIQRLEGIGFVWNMRKCKSASARAAAEAAEVSNSQEGIDEESINDDDDESSAKPAAISSMSAVTNAALISRVASAVGYGGVQAV